PARDSGQAMRPTGPAEHGRREMRLNEGKTGRRPREVPGSLRARRFRRPLVAGRLQCSPRSSRLKTPRLETETTIVETGLACGPAWTEDIDMFMPRAASGCTPLAGLPSLRDTPLSGGFEGRFLANL